MKKFIFSLVFVLALVICISPAFALVCKNGNYGSDECWTTGMTSTNDGAILTGTVMVYDFITPTQQGNDADRAAFYVRAATTSDQMIAVAGVAQRDYASGDRVELLVRGQGKFRANAALASMDKIYVIGGTTAATKGLATNALPLAPANSRDRAIAFSLGTTSAAATADAYIVIV